MNTVQRIVKNTGVLLVSQIASYILGFFFIMYTARYLGAEGFGILSFALAFTGIFGVFTNLGLNTLTAREVARDKSLASKYLGNIAVMKILLVAITFGLIALTINLLGYPEQTIKVVYLVALSVILSAFSGLFYSTFQAYEKLEYQSIGQILNSALMLSGALVAISYGFSVAGFASIYFLASAVALGYTFAICMWKFAKPKLEVDWSFWKETIKEAWPMGGMAVCIVIYFRIDTVMLSLMMDDTAVGLYGAAYRLSEISTIIPSMFMASVFPVLSKYHADSMSSFVSTYEKSVKYLFYLALPMALIVTLLAKPIVNLIFGSEFLGSVIALQILIWAAAIMYVTMVQGTTIITANKQRVSFIVTVVAAVLNIILNLIVIPKYSYIGASATTVATEAFGFFVGIFFLNRWGYKLNMTNVYLPPLLGLCTAAVVAIILINMAINIYIISMVVIVIYGLIVYKMGIKEDDKLLIRNLFNSFKH
jgi:O-antigen/teichoic acid export membrane protein